MKHLLIYCIVCLTGCTYTISLANTTGEASDVIDDTTTPTVETTVKATIPAVTP